MNKRGILYFIMSSNKPPLGIMTEKRWKEIRISDLQDAIQRYWDAGYRDHAFMIMWQEQIEKLQIEIEITYGN